MPLSDPGPRELIHTRTIEMRGFRRPDDQIEVEAHLTDVKTHPISTLDRDQIPPGEPLHGMWMRMVVTREMEITSCEAWSEFTPYAICPNAAASSALLAGLSIKPGFLKEAAGRVGGTSGCTHLREMLQQVATTAYQTLVSLRLASSGEEVPSSAHLENTCYAYASDGPIIRRLREGS